MLTINKPQHIITLPPEDKWTPDDRRTVANVLVTDIINHGEDNPLKKGVAVAVLFAATK